MDMDGKPNSVFSAEDIDIKKDQPARATAAPEYLMCDLFQARARVNIMILSQGMDCRLAIRTGSCQRADFTFCNRLD
jgi:hypothetical protein